MRRSSRRRWKRCAHISATTAARIFAGTELTVVVTMRFPLEHLYRDAAAEHGITLQFMTAAEFCANVGAATDKAAGTSCGRSPLRCGAPPAGGVSGGSAGPDPHAAGGVAIYVFDVACDPQSTREWSSPQLLEVPLPAR